MVRLTYYGHSCFLIEGGGKKVLIDPYVTGNPLSPIKSTELSPDHIIVTHGHGDHLGDTVEIAKSSGATVISNFEIASYVEKQGCKMHPLHIGGAAKFDFGTAKLTIAHHGSCLPDGSYGGNPAGVLLEIAGKRVYHAGDTALFYDMKLIGRRKVDAALLPIGDNFTMGPEDALEAVKLIEPAVVVPMHYDTFDIVKQDPEAFKASVEKETKSSCVILKPGESYELS
ncbi:MAG: metal-dependent hydrolase [Candidatus Eiseniibacteriota bacterium]|nr:MAG: metal-dependent hydrolase [Candidatus Eisenbacteria bacterium]